jgi:hypothetical protein
MGMKKKQTVSDNQYLTERIKQFVTDNPYLAAAITEQLQIDPIPIVQNGWTHFSYPVSDKLYEAINAFNNGLALNAFSYSQTIKRFRGIAITKRKEISDERGIENGYRKNL